MIEAGWVRAHKFDASPARHLVVPGKDGGIGQVLVAGDCTWLVC